MAKLSRDQIAMYARSAGLSGGAVDIAVAVALAESGGNPKAHNPIPPDNSYGLWQINMLGNLGPDRRRKLRITSNSQLFDPAVNARAMAMISGNGSNWQPWSTYTNGAYKKHMSGGATQTGLTDVPGNAVDAATNLIPGMEGVTAVAELAVGAGEWIADKHNWLRITQVAVGAILVVVGLQVTASGALRPMVAKAAKIMPQGKGLKAAAAAKG